VCTRIYRFFNPERAEEFSDYQSSPSASSSDSFRHRFRKIFGALFPLLKRDNTQKPGKAGESRRVITVLSLSQLSRLSFRSVFSSRRTKRESATRLSFSSIESGEFNFESRAHRTEGGSEVHKRYFGEEESDGRKLGGEDGGKTRAENFIPPASRGGGALSLPSLPPQSMLAPPASVQSSSAPSYLDSDPATNLGSSRFFRSSEVRQGEIGVPLPEVEEADIGATGRSAPT
jgi:hypothetical protein